MRLRFPLYLKILVWFFLNLAVLACLFLGLVRTQFRPGFGGLLLGQVGERVLSVAGLIAFELGQARPADWDGVLQRFGEAYGVAFLVVWNNGERVAGEPVDLPAALRGRLSEERAVAGGPRFGGPRGPGPMGGPPGPRAGYGAGVRALPPSVPFVRFTLRTEPPPRYWVGVRLPMAERDRPRPGPLTLLVMSDSISGHGLFFDVWPWAVAGFGAVVISVLFWVPLVRGITRSLGRMSRATERIAEGHFDARLPETRGDELGSLSASINRMASRLDGFVSGQKRFLGDTAHELCSPIARMQVALGILEQRAGPTAQAGIEDLREEVQEMAGLVNELLSFSKASLGDGVIRCEPVQLRPLAERAVEREAKPGAEVRMEVPEDAWAHAQSDLVLRALANVVRNACRYASTDGPIIVGASRLESEVILTVKDHGPGIPEAALSKVFDPFYRVDVSRDRETGGAGLGLAIVKTCIEACGGTVTCRNRVPAGLEVVMRLPAAPAGPRPMVAR